MRRRKKTKPNNGISHRGGGVKQKSIVWLQVSIHSKTTRMNSSPFPAHIAFLPACSRESPICVPSTGGRTALHHIAHAEDMELAQACCCTKPIFFLLSALGHDAEAAMPRRGQVQFVLGEQKRAATQRPASLAGGRPSAYRSRGRFAVSSPSVVSRKTMIIKHLSL